MWLLLLSYITKVDLTSKWSDKICERFFIMDLIRNQEYPALCFIPKWHALFCQVGEKESQKVVTYLNVPSPPRFQWASKRTLQLSKGYYIYPRKKRSFLSNHHLKTLPVAYEFSIILIRGKIRVETNDSTTCHPTFTPLFDDK